MTKAKLKELKSQCMESLVRWAMNGKKIGNYFCNHCEKNIPCRIPDKSDVGEKGYWDSTTICIECGHCNFVCEYPSGKTKSKKMPF